jgi:glycosyltransferase involved in cell wall biosynthesis
MYKFKKSKFLVLIPAYNELKNLKKFVKKIVKFLPVYVLDDCSIDNTEQWLRKNNIKYLKNKKNLGYEKNLINGIKKLKNQCDFLITFDGDGQHKVSDLKKIINIKTSYDIIVSNRKNKNRILEEVISATSQIFFDLKDPLTGFKVYKTKILKKENFNEIGDFFLVDFLLNLLKKKIEMINFEIITNKRIGDSKVGGRIDLTLKEFKILFKLIFKKIYLKLFI